jgi:hypothetical protein
MRDGGPTIDRADGGQLRPPLQAWAATIAAAGVAAGGMCGVVQGDIAAGLAVGIPIWLIALAIEIRECIDWSTRHFSAAVTLRQQTEYDGFLQARVSEVLRLYPSIHGVHPANGDYADRARDALARCVAELKELDSGRMPVERSRGVMVLSKALEEEREQFRAVSRGPIWKDQAGKNYNRLNIERASRGLSISRIFILDGDRDDATIDAITAQVEAEIHVYVIDEKEVPRGLAQGLAIFGKTDGARLPTVFSLDQVREDTLAPPDAPRWMFDVTRELVAARKAEEDFEVLRRLSRRVWNEQVEDRSWLAPA